LFWKKDTHTAFNSFGNGRYLLACFLIPAYFVIFFASTWYHSHTNESHGAIESSAFHSHIRLSSLIGGEDNLFSYSTSSSAQQYTQEVIHLSGPGIPLLVPYYLPLTVYRNFPHAPKLILKMGCYAIHGTAPSPIPSAIDYLQESLPTFSAQELVILIGTDLPPPIS